MKPCRALFSVVQYERYQRLFKPGMPDAMSDRESTSPFARFLHHQPRSQATSVADYADGDAFDDEILPRQVNHDWREIGIFGKQLHGMTAL